MSTTTHGTDRAGEATALRVVASELVKLRLRSTVVILVVAALLIIAIGAFMAIGVVVQEAPNDDGFADPPSQTPALATFAGVSSALFAVAALGVLSVTNEFGSGSIQSTLSAVPRRSRVVLGKTLAVAAVVVTVALPALLVTFFAVRLVLARAGESVSLGEPGVLRAIVGAALYLAVVAVLAAGLGWLIRSTLGAYLALLVLLFFIPSIAAFVLPEGVGARILPYMPDSAGNAVMQLGDPVPGQLAPWVGLGVFALYALVALGLATVAVRRRDI